MFIIITPKNITISIAAIITIITLMGVAIVVVGSCISTIVTYVEACHIQLQVAVLCAHVHHECHAHLQAEAAAAGATRASVS